MTKYQFLLKKKEEGEWMEIYEYHLKHPGGMDERRTSAG